VHEGKVATLKRFKDDANEVRAGLECGIKLDDFNGYETGDVIECFEIQKVRASLYLHTHHQSETVAVTITSVEIDDDLRTGRIFVGVIGTPEFAEDRMRWLKKHSEEIRRELGRRVVLKWNPKWVYVLDDSGERGARIQRVLNEIEAREAPRRKPDEGSAGSTV
jgi:ribosome-binding factor A